MRITKLSIFYGAQEKIAVGISPNADTTAGLIRAIDFSGFAD